MEIDEISEWLVSHVHVILLEECKCALSLSFLFAVIVKYSTLLITVVLFIV